MQPARDRIETRFQTRDVGFHVDDRIACNARIHGGLGNGCRDVRQQSRIERRRDDVARAEGRPFAVKGGRDLIGYLGARQLGDGFGGRDLHGVVDRRRLDVERAAENEGEAEHVIDLIGIVGAPGRHDGIGADRFHVLRLDLGIGVGHREDQRLFRHARDKLARQHAGGGEAEEDIGTIDDVGERSCLRLLRVRCLIGVHQLLAALVDDAFDIADEDVFAFEPELDEQVEAGEGRGTRAGANELDLADVLCRRP